MVLTQDLLLLRWHRLFGTDMGYAAIRGFSWEEMTRWTDQVPSYAVPLVF